MGHEVLADDLLDLGLLRLGEIRLGSRRGGDQHHGRDAGCSGKANHLRDHGVGPCWKLVMKSQWHTGLLCRFECRDVVGLAILPENASWRDWQVGAPRAAP